VCIYTSTPPIRLHGVSLFKHRDFSLVYSNIHTKSVEQNPSGKANSRSASEKTPRLLCNTNVHYRAQKNQPLVPILSHVLNPVHTPDPIPLRSVIYDSSIYIRSFKWSLPFRFSDKNYACAHTHFFLCCESLKYCGEHCLKATHSPPIL